jgi:hypothetical protein
MLGSFFKNIVVLCPSPQIQISSLPKHLVQIFCGHRISSQSEIAFWAENGRSVHVIYVLPSLVYEREILVYWFVLDSPIQMASQIPGWSRTPILETKGHLEKLVSRGTKNIYSIFFGRLDEHESPLDGSQSISVDLVGAKQGAVLEGSNADINKEKEKRPPFYRIPFSVKRVLAIFVGLCGWVGGFGILSHGWDLTSINRNCKDIRIGERFTLLGGVLIIGGTAAILIGLPC